MVTITVGGLPGSGTTTACRKLREKLNLPYIYAGHIFRGMADEAGMTLAEFGRYCEDHPEVDKELDRRQLEILKHGDVIVEGRLSGWLAIENDIPALTVWLWAPVDVRAGRIVEREGGELKEKREEMLEREFSEAKRYRTFYGMDLQDQERYDVVLETHTRTPDQVVDAILVALEEKRDEL
ncbi:MAG: AAA family ATPase [Euryarchaeota archaeon]|nr:AAA family ATPase [Euryarchaeota archaeon]